MKHLALTIITAGICLSGPVATAQKIKWETGDGLPFLKDQKMLAVDYDYSKITVKGGSEEEFLKAQKEELNKEEPGKGDDYVSEWTEARAAKYQVHFETQFNKDLKDDGVTIKPGTDAKYTLIVVANDMEVGKGKTFVSKPATIDFTLFLVETANKSNILAKGNLEDVEGEVNAPKGSRWIPGGAGTVMAVSANVQNRAYSNRLAESYEKAAAIFAKYIRKTVL